MLKGLLSCLESAYSIYGYLIVCSRNSVIKTPTMLYVRYNLVRTSGLVAARATPSRVLSNFGYTRAPGPECIGPGARVSPECIGPVLSIFWARAASDGALLRRSIRGSGRSLKRAKNLCSVRGPCEISAVCAPEMRPPVSNLANNQYFICACSDLGQQLPALEAWYLMVTGAQGVCGLSSTLGPE